MNGIHDMGGMHGMGPICPERNEPVFHEPWEGRVFAMVRAMGAWGKWNIDASRYQREQIPPGDYLRMGYYEKWLWGLEKLLVMKGLISRAEIDSGHPLPDAPKLVPALKPENVPALVAKGSPANRTPQAPPRFSVGQHVRARNIQPPGHTRLPRYARARQGVIERIHGVFVFPDSNASFHGESPQHLYSVRFTARELWGELAVARDLVYIDLWEHYLEQSF
jgi:nitrile hydratase subunit beta